MIILSHRGCWKKTCEKNKPVAFERSFSLGFGVETDIRDYKGDLVISHDIATGDDIKVEEFFEIYSKYDSELPLALNIKSDGLQFKIFELIKRFGIKNYFVFDMSIADTLGYIKGGGHVFTRESEYEDNACFYDEISGVWLDEFKRHWIDVSIIKKHYENEKTICIVSPELHNRDFHKEWEDYKEMENRLRVNDLMICTDYPEEAEVFFNE